MESENLEPQLPKETLDEMSATEFNDKIISLPVFLCKKCEKVLTRPIMLVASVGNVCGSCNDDKVNISIHNTALEAVLEMLELPCCYYKEGCREKLPYVEMSPHISLCRYRNYFCPLKLFEPGCMWKGRPTDLLEHGTVDHRGFVISNDCNIVELKLDISKDNEIVNLLGIGNNTFLLHIKCDLHTLKQYYAIYYIGAADKAQEFLYSISQTGCSGLDSILLRSGNTLKDVDFTRRIEENAFAVDLSLIIPLVSNRVMSVQIKIISLNETEEVQTELLTSFECPVCNNYMRQPIFQCLSGHSICNQCRPKLGHCPTCRSGFGCTRNFALESICGNVKFPCIYRDIGCRAVLKSSEAEKHEAECPLKAFDCPFNESACCVWAGPLDGLINHLQIQHNEKVIFANYNRVSVPFSFDTNFFSLYCMVVNAEVFRVCHKRDTCNQNSYWAVQLIGSRSECKNYRTEIGLIDGRNEHRRLVRVDLIQELSNLDNMLNQSISIPSTTVSWFNWNGQVTYYCKIAKIK